MNSHAMSDIRYMTGSGMSDIIQMIPYRSDEMNLGIIRS